MKFVKNVQFGVEQKDGREGSDSEWLDGQKQIILIYQYGRLTSKGICRAEIWNILIIGSSILLIIIFSSIY